MNIVDIDYWENDAILEWRDNRIYFQWDGTRPPTIEDALNYILADYIVTDKYSHQVVNG